MKKSLLLLLAPLAMATSCSAQADYKLCSFLQVAGVDYSNSVVQHKLVGTYELEDGSLTPPNAQTTYYLSVSYAIDTESTLPTVIKSLPSTVKLNVSVPSEGTKYFNLSLRSGTTAEYTTTQDSYYSSPTRSIRINIHQDKLVSGSTSYSTAYSIVENDSGVYNVYVQGKTESGSSSYVTYEIQNTKVEVKTKEIERYADLGDSTLVIYSYKS